MQTIEAMAMESNGKEASEMPPTDQPGGGDPFQGKDVLIDPMTGERIFSPERAKKIDEDLARQKAKRKNTGGTDSTP
jgi:hypothetical protein